MIERPDTRLPARLHASPNIEPRRGGTRPDMLLLHYTGMKTCAAAIDWLARPESKVSCHYVIDADGTITQMVREVLRAWHAGIGAWDGCADVNSCSIGIEIHNPGHDLGYPDFPDLQMQAVITLCSDIVTRWAIPARRVLAHSDIAPARKIDPGEKFDWARLARAGIGHWIDPAPVDAVCPDFETFDIIAEAQSLLQGYGYEIRITGKADARTRIVVAAFQRHFRPARVDGTIDASTLDTLRRLVSGGS